MSLKEKKVKKNDIIIMVAQLGFRKVYWYASIMEPFGDCCWWERVTWNSASNAINTHSLLGPCSVVTVSYLSETKRSKTLCESQESKRQNRRRSKQNRSERLRSVLFNGTELLRFIAPKRSEISMNTPYP